MKWRSNLICTDLSIHIWQLQDTFGLVLDREWHARVSLYDEYLNNNNGLVLLGDVNQSNDNSFYCLDFVKQNAFCVIPCLLSAVLYKIQVNVSWWLAVWSWEVAGVRRGGHED